MEPIEPAVVAQIQKTVDSHHGPSTLTLSRLYVRVGRIFPSDTFELNTCDGLSSAEPCEAKTHFGFHDRWVWHWPWWAFPTRGGSYEWDGFNVVMYTHPLSFEDVKRHGHLYWESHP